MTFLRTPLWRSPVWLAALLVAALAAGLHFYFLSHAGGFWRDEVNLLNLSQRPSLADLQKDSFPVLLPLLVRGWLGLGLGEAGLRGLGLAIGVGLLAALVFASWKINRTPPLLGLALFGLNSTVIIFGDSLRAYGLGCLFIVLVVLGGAFFLQRPGWRRAAWLAAASVLSVQTLYHNAILVGAVCLGAMLVCASRKHWAAVAQVFVAGAVAALSLLPYVPNFTAAQADSATLRTGLKLPRLLAGFTDLFGFPVAQYTWIWAVLGIGLLVHGGLAWRRRRGGTTDELSQNELVLFAAVTVTASFVGFFIFLWLAAFPSQAWYLLPLLAVTVTSLDFVWPFWDHRLRLALLAFFLASAVLAVPATTRLLAYRFTNVDIWTQQMKPHVAPGDYVIVVPWFCGITFGHYLANPVAWDTLPPLADHATHRFDLVKAQLQNPNAIQPVLQNIAAALQSGHRVWVLSLKGWMDVPEPGTTAAASLPPAPSPRWGWSEVPYTTVWVSQVAHFIGDRSTQFARVQNPAATGPFIEDTELFLAAGWRDEVKAAPVK